MKNGELDGTGFETLDTSFNNCIIAHARIERLWPDIPNNRLLRWDETDGTVTVFRAPCNNTNGNTVDLQGRLIFCEHLTRRVTRTEHDGSITVVADNHNGKRSNSPNDVDVKSDVSFCFTDPSCGILMD